MSALDCAACCDCPVPAVETETNSGSVSKCGFLDGGEYYLTQVGGCGETDGTYDPETCTATYADGEDRRCCSDCATCGGYDFSGTLYTGEQRVIDSADFTQPPDQLPATDDDLKLLVELWDGDTTHGTGELTYASFFHQPASKIPDPDLAIPSPGFCISTGKFLVGGIGTPLVNRWREDSYVSVNDGGYRYDSHYYEWTLSVIDEPTPGNPTTRVRYRARVVTYDSGGAVTYDSGLSDSSTDYAGGLAQSYWDYNYASFGMVSDLLPYGDVKADITTTYEDLFTDEMLVDLATPGAWAGTFSGGDNVGTEYAWDVDHHDLTITLARYRFRFEHPQAGARCYRINWVERQISTAGEGIDSVSVHAAGVYRPGVTATESGGSGAVLVAVLNSTGGVASIRVLNPGTGYVTPTISVAAAIAGGTTSTGWSATVSGGKITAVTGGSLGDYRPTIEFSYTAGTAATATCTLTPEGGVAAVTVTGAGSGYDNADTATAITKVATHTPADLLLHMGTEIARSWQWSPGDLPAGYDVGDPSTYPIAGDGALGYFTLRPPSGSDEGEVYIANARATCRGCEETSNVIPAT